MSRFGIDERNLSRLNPILGLNRVSSELTSWHKTVHIDESGAIELTCHGGQDVVPHGMDADIMFALTTAYELQGYPSNHIVELTMSQLCNLAGLKPGGATYQKVQRSIQRLHGVRYSAQSCWAIQSGSKTRWETLDFSIVDYVHATDTVLTGEEKNLFAATTKLQIGLGIALVISIKNGFTRRINLDFYSKIDQPLGRLLYRTLEENRKDKQVIFPLKVWAEHLGLCEIDRTAKVKKYVTTKTLSSKRVKRSLDSAHSNLIKLGYLKDVEYIGRGENLNIRYIFGEVVDKIDIVDNKLVIMLIDRGISKGRANELVLNYSRQQIDEAIQYFDKRVSEGFKPRNRGGVLSDILMNPNKYQNLEDTNVNSPRTLSSRSSITGNPVELSQPPRSKQQVEAVLSNVLEQTTADRELRERLIVQFVDGQHSIMDFITLARLSDTEARAKAAELLSL